MQIYENCATERTVPFNWQFARDQSNSKVMGDRQAKCNFPAKKAFCTIQGLGLLQLEESGIYNSEV